MGRLIVVSNRVPLNGPGSGGLVTALHEALCQEGGVWIGSQPTDRDTPRPEFQAHEDAPYEKLTFDLTPKDEEDYYLGYANSVLWPLCHRRTDLLAIETRFKDGYHRVNRRLAKMLARILRPEDRLWVQDYHFFPLAHYLRAEGCTNRIGFFLHIPFPHSSDLPALPEHEAFPRWIGAYDLVGLQTRRDVAVCLEMFRARADSEMLPDGSVKTGGRRFRVRSFPIGIDVGIMREAAVRNADKAAEMNLKPGERLLIGVDRLDYSKGLVNRLNAFGTFLDRRLADEPRVSMLQIAPPTREDVKAYQEIRDNLELASGRINGMHSDIGWVPVHYIHKPVDRAVLAALYRRADVGLVTPLADGMNLVAKEYVAAQDPDDPGVLVLSRFAGAAEQLNAAILVNPYDISEMADAIVTALAMPLSERRARHASMLAAVEKQDIGWWRRSFLTMLDDDSSFHALDMRPLAV